MRCSTRWGVDMDTDELPNLYHGTSPENAERILRDGFHPRRHRKRNVSAKASFVYLSTALLFK